MIISVLSLLIYAPLHALIFGFDNMIAVGWRENLLQIVAQGILSGPLATYLSAYAASVLGTGRGATFSALVPGFTILIGVVALGEMPTLIQLAGLGVVAIGFQAGDEALTTEHQVSGPAYFPAVAGNIDLMILNFEMSAVASMCRKIAASRKIFSTPKSSITPLPPCSSTACCATFMISSEANTLAMLHSVSASGALSSTACAARPSSARTASMLRRHVGKPQRHRLMLDQDAPALHVVLHVVGRDLEGAHADAEILRRPG